MLEVDVYRDAHSQFISIDGMRVHFRRQGKGPTVVLLHGSGSSLHCYDKVVSELVSYCEVITLDLPGFGLTGPRPDRDYRIDTYVSFLKRFLDVVGISNCLLAGNSLGGNIAWNFALDYPQVIRYLVLMNATGYPQKSLPLAMRLAKNPVGRLLLRKMVSRHSIKSNLRKLIGPRMQRIDDALVDRVYAMMRCPGNMQAFIDLANTEQRDRSRCIPQIKVPTLVMRGDLIDGQYFSRDIHESEEIVYKDVGHLIPDEIPSQVALVVRKNLR